MVRLTLLTAIAVGLLTQSPGPTQVTINQIPAAGRIGVYYFSGTNETHVWVNLEPEGTEKAGIDPLLLNITAKFPGKRIDKRPMMLDLTAQVRCTPIQLPSRIWRPEFKLRIGTDPVLDLSANGRSSQFVATCAAIDPRATLNAVATYVPVETMGRLADVGAGSMDAIGFSARFRQADIETLRRFLALIEHGVVVKTP